MNYNTQRFIGDFKIEWQRQLIERMIKKQKMFSFSLHGEIMRAYSIPLIEVVRFTNFLTAIGFMDLSNYRFTVSTIWIPKNQRTASTSIIK